MLNERDLKRFSLFLFFLFFFDVRKRSCNKSIPCIARLCHVEAIDGASTATRRPFEKTISWNNEGSPKNERTTIKFTAVDSFRSGRIDTKRSRVCPNGDKELIFGFTTQRSVRVSRNEIYGA